MWPDCKIYSRRTIPVRDACLRLVFITWRHLPSFGTGSKVPSKEWGRTVWVCRFVRSFVPGDGDRGNWSPWLPWRGFDEGVWGIDAASSVASGGLRSFRFSSPSGGGVQQVGLPYRVVGFYWRPVGYIVWHIQVGDPFEFSLDLGYVHFREWSGLFFLTIVKNRAEIYSTLVSLWSKNFQLWCIFTFLCILIWLFLKDCLII